MELARPQWGNGSDERDHNVSVQCSRQKTEESPALGTSMPLKTYVVHVYPCL